MLLFVTSSDFFTVLNLVLYLCNVFLFDLNLEGLLHKFLLLFHGNYFTLCYVFLDLTLCIARCVSFLACDAGYRFSATCSKIDLLKLDDLWSFLGCLSSAPATLLADGMKFLSMRARMPSQIVWSSASTFATYSFAYDACCLLCAIYLLCAICSSLSATSTADWASF